MVPERLAKLFESAAYEVKASGGDGDGTVVFAGTSVQEVAAAFEEWHTRVWGVMTKPSTWLPHRHDYSPEYVLFSDESNESLTFVSKRAAETLQRSHSLELWMEVW